MNTVTPPELNDVAQALLVVAKNHREYDQAALELLAWGLLPNTEPTRGARVITAIASSLEQAETYEGTSPEQMAGIFGEITDPETDEAVAGWLIERAKVWRGEAETTALRAAGRDRGLLQ